MNERDKELLLQAKMVHRNLTKIDLGKFEKFADLIRADEREACALICDDQARSAYWEGADACATEIRARGDK